jgi:transcriptional regulator with XRE-family HTH domain
MQIETKAQEILDALGGRIRKARTQSGLTQEALAAKANVSISTLSKIETGTSTPTLEVLFRIAMVLEQTPNALTGWQEPKLSGDARKRAALIDEVRSILAPVPTEQLEALVALITR